MVKKSLLAPPARFAAKDEKVARTDDVPKGLGNCFVRFDDKFPVQGFIPLRR